MDRQSGTAPNGAVPLFETVTRLGQGGSVCGRQLTHNGEPGGLSGLPGAPVLAAHVGPVDDLAATAAVGLAQHTAVEPGAVGGGGQLPLRFGILCLRGECYAGAWLRGQQPAAG